MKLICVKDSAYLNDFENVLQDIVHCITVLNIGPGSKPIQFFQGLYGIVFEVKKDWQKKIEPKLKTVSWDTKDREFIETRLRDAFRELDKYSPTKPVWKEFGGLGNDKRPYSDAYSNLVKSSNLLKNAVKI